MAIKIMYKQGLILFAVFTMLPIAFADRATPMSGDEDFLADAYRAAEDGTDFSYARIWGQGLAYDGTDTSGFVAQRNDVETGARLETPKRTDYITRPSEPVIKDTKIWIPLRGRHED